MNRTDRQAMNRKFPQLVKEWNLVAEEFNQLVRISDVLTCGHRLGPDTLVQTLQALVTTRTPDFLQAGLDCILVVGVTILEPLLKIRDSKDTLKGGIDPTRPALIAKAEHF